MISCFYPALKRWAKLGRPFGAGFLGSPFHRIARKLIHTHSSHTHSKGAIDSVEVAISLNRLRKKSSKVPEAHLRR